MNETETYRAHGHVALRGLFPPDLIGAFYNQMVRDLQAAGRPIQGFAARGPLLKQDAIEVYAYQYAPMVSFLWGLTPRIAQATGCELLPTYAYFRAYRRGDVCRVHTDRPACEHSLSLTIAYGKDLPWALAVGHERIDVPRPVVTDDFGGEGFDAVAMMPGDGVLYQGTHYRHGRLDPNPNSWSAHLFLHWIDRNGRYAEHAFDRPAMERAGNVART